MQGSNLGPTLFLLIYINDIIAAVSGGASGLDMTSSILSLFADETKWGRCVDSVEDIQKFQEGIDRLDLWSRTWQMKFNTDKCKVIHLGRKGNTGHTYMMGVMELNTSTAEKDIGVMVQDSLKPSLHCAKAAAKANGMYNGCTLSMSGLS